MTLSAAVISLALSGCTLIISTGIFTDVVTAHGVQIVAAVSAHATAVDSVAARITNTGPRAVFIPRCGPGPLLHVQQLINGQWTDAAEAACPPGGAVNPIELDPGSTVVAVKVFTTGGRFRLATTVGDSEDFGNSARSTSNSFALP